MSLSIDNNAVLRAIADHPDAFPAVQKEISEFANKVLVKQLKAAKTEISILRKICSFVREKNLQTVLDTFEAKDLKGLAKRIDKHSSLVGDARPVTELRTHIIGLANGSLEPTTAPARPSKSAPKGSSSKKTPARSKIGEVLGSQVHSGSAKRPR